MADAHCPFCTQGTETQATVKLSDGSRVCRKCGHIVTVPESTLECECIRCWELRNPAATGGNSVGEGIPAA